LLPNCSRLTFNRSPTIRLSPWIYGKHEIGIRNGIHVALLNFAVTPAVRADCLLVTPSSGAARTGAIVWMHSNGVYEQLPDAMLLAQAGAVSLLINPVSPDWNAAATTWREPMLRAAVSIRRGVDLLLQRRDIDAQRLAFVGHSYGAMIGVDAVAADRRFRTSGNERAHSHSARSVCVGFANQARPPTRRGAQPHRTPG
jgi:hypothetical protein